ncbi:MAG: hypothetical protein IT181_02535 [Acidobacteria bacterium]|nr:hypothetical protein [Acidobacteriota bacterium]
MKGAAWLAGLTALVLTALWPVSPEGQFRRSLQRARTGRPPAIDGYAPGHRAIWGTSAPLDALLGPTDRLVEVVTPEPVSIAQLVNRGRLVESPLETAPRRASLVLVLTVTDLENALVETAEARAGRQPRFETRRVFARVDEVIKNQSARPMLAGTSIVFSYEGGGETTINGTRVVTRRDGERLPQRGRQYLWFLGANRDGIYGGSAMNAFDISGRRLVPLAKRRGFADLGRVAPQAALDLVRQRATLPELREYEQESGVHRGPIVQQPMRMALR